MSTISQYEAIHICIICKYWKQITSGFFMIHAAIFKQFIKWILDANSWVTVHRQNSQLALYDVQNDSHNDLSRQRHINQVSSARHETSDKITVPQYSFLLILCHFRDLLFNTTKGHTSELYSTDSIFLVDVSSDIRFWVTDPDVSIELCKGWIQQTFQFHINYFQIRWSHKSFQLRRSRWKTSLQCVQKRFANMR